MSKPKKAGAAPIADPNAQPGDIPINDAGPDYDASDPIVLKDDKGNLFNASSAQAARDAQTNLGYQPASPEEVQAHDAAKAEREKYGTTGQQALAAGEAALGAATFGATVSNSPEAEARRRQLHRDSPIVEMGAKMAGALAPALLTGGAAEAAVGGEAVLAGSRAARMGVQAVGDFAGGLSAEAETAVEQKRNIDLGNVAMWTIGGVVGDQLIRAGLSSAKGAFRNNVLPAARTEAEAFRNGSAMIGKDAREVAPGVYVDRAGNTVKRDLSREDVAEIVANYDQHVNAARDLGKTAGNSFQESFDDAHSIGNRADDLRALLPESNEAMARFGSEQADAAQAFADRLQARGNTQAAKLIGQHVDHINGATDAAELADNLNRLKLTVQKFRKKVATASRVSGNDAYGEAVAEIDALETPLRKGLESKKIWGDAVASKQIEENANWQTFIKESARVNDALLGEAPGGRDYDGYKSFEMKDEKIVKFLNLDARGQADVLASADKMLTSAEKMTEVKRALGLRPEDLTQVTSDIKDMRSFFQQVRDLTDARVQGADLIEKAKAGESVGAFVDAALHHVPGGSLVHKAIDYFSEPTIFEKEQIFTRDEARQMVEDRLKGRIASTANSAPASRAGVNPAPSDLPRRLLELGGQQLTSTNINSDDMAELSAHGRAFIDKSASRFASGGTRPPPLPSAAERFKGNFQTLQQAFEARRSLLAAYAQDPMHLVNHVANSFGDLPETHPQAFQTLATRIASGLAYMSQNMPPSIGYSMRDPAGLPADAAAVREFARKWDAVFTPANTIHDLVGGKATPQQMKALSAVHPDLFGQLQHAIIAKMSARLQPPPYESQRYLDQVMQLDGAYSPALGSKVAANIRNSLAVAKPNPMRLGNDKLQSSTTNPRGIASIAAGPTTSD